MKLYIRALGAAASGLLIIAATSLPARAHHIDDLNKISQKCRDQISKGFGKALKSAAKVSAGCHKSRNSGSIDAGTDCNDLSASEADSAGKFAKARTKLEDTLAKQCTTPGAGREVLDEFTTCPEPCATSEGLPNPMTSFAQLAKCLGCLARDTIETAHVTMLGSPVSPGDAEQDCHAAIAKGYDKLITTIQKDRTNCQKSQDKAGNTHLQPCDTADAKDKISGATTKAEEGLDAACGGASLSVVNSCATNLTDLKTCLKTEADAAGGSSFTSGFELAASICPLAITTKILAGYDDEGLQSRTSLELGFSGLSHDADLPDGYYINTSLTCPGSTAGACGDCTVDGIAAGPQYATFLRCANNFALKCNTLFGPDVACGGSPCVYILGPPLPLQAANNPTCTINQLTDDISGTVDPDTGSSQLKISLRSKTHTGGTVTLTHPCPVCVGDITPRDGVRDGTCSGGGNDGNPCDVDAFDATFAAEINGEGLALDCPPTTSTNISGAGLPIPFDFTTGHSQLDTDTKCDSPLAFLDCFCAVCTLNTVQPCRNNAECATRGACTALGVCEFDSGLVCTTNTDCAVASGTCTSKGGGNNRQPNSCTGLTANCTPTVDDRAECSDPADDLTFCDGVVRANGNGYIACIDDSSCTNSECDDTTPGLDGCGKCTTPGKCTSNQCADLAPCVTNADCNRPALSQPKPCFLDPIVKDGEADTENPLLVSTFCLPPTNNNAINGAAGLPGPARVAADMDTHLTYY